MEMTAEKIGGILLILFILGLCLYIFVSPKGALANTLKAAIGLESLLPTSHTEVIKNVDIPKEAESYRNTLSSTLVDALSKQASNCRVDLPEISSAGKYQIEIANNKATNQFAITLVEEQKSGVVRHTSKISEGKLCVADKASLALCAQAFSAACPKGTSSCPKKISEICPTSKIATYPETTTFSKETLSPYAIRLDDKTLCLLPKDDPSWYEVWKLSMSDCNLKDTNGIRDSCIESIKGGVSAC